MRIVRVVNASKNSIVADRAELADSFFTRLRGLLGRRALADGQGLVLQPGNSIHSFFMRFPFDAIFLDRAGRVLHLMSDMRPNRVSPIVRGAHTIVELPVGAIARSRTAPGDQLDLH